MRAAALRIAVSAVAVVVADDARLPPGEVADAIAGWSCSLAPWTLRLGGRSRASIAPGGTDA